MPNIELMLLEHVDHLGDPGDVVQVKKGFARNFLLPRRMAAPVSQDAVRQAKKAKVRIEEVRAKHLADAQERAAALQDQSVHVEAKATEGGHLFGSVTAAMIAEALGRDGFSVEPQQIHLEEPIKELGIYDVSIKIHGGVSAGVKLYVVEPAPTAEEAAAAAAAAEAEAAE